LYLRYVPLVRGLQVILFPVAFLLFSTTLIKREYGIFLFLFLIPVSNSLPYFFHLKSFPVSIVLFLFLFLSLLMRCLIFNEKPFKMPKMPFFKAFFFISIFSFIISFLRYSNFFPFIEKSIHEWIVNAINVRAGGAIASVITESITIIAGLLFLSILVAERDERFLRKSLLFFTAGLSISAIFSIFQFLNSFVGVEDFWVKIRRVNGLASDPNSLGITISLIIPFLLFLIFKEKKVFLVSLLPIFLISLFLSGSRSGFLNLFFSTSLFLFLILKFRREKIIFVLYALLFVSLSAITIYVLRPEKINLSYRLWLSINQLKKGDIEKLSMGRTLLWKAGYHMSKDFPLCGVGLGAYVVELPNFYKIYNITPVASLGDYQRGLSPPLTDTSGNLYIQLLSETGFPGFLSFSIFWFYTLIVSSKEKEKAFTLSSLWSFSAISLFGFHILNPEVMFAVFLLLGFLVKEKEESKTLRYFQLFLILTFTFSFLFSSITSLSIRKRTEKFGWEQSYGLYREETYENGKFRWSKRGAGFELYLPSSFFTIELNASHPDIEKKPVKVKVFVSTKPFLKKNKIDEFTLKENGWKKRGYFLKEFSNRKVFISFEVSRTWNPLKELKIPDPRDIGIGLGKIDFKFEEIGFYGWERDSNGINFRWASKLAWLPLVPSSDKISFPVRISHPDAQKKPVQFIVTINGNGVVREIFNDHNWYEIDLDLRPYIGKEILIGFSVSRTWCPCDYNINDKRELGIAIGKFY
ncbi:MAG: O-antigen ligase family protein, partial [Candidatus Aminicenantia bacterium]